MNLLVVDDIEANRISLEYLIEEYCKEDIEVVQASSGEEALKVAYREDIDLIILDIQMPGLDGFETAQYLKSNQKTENIPIIFLTAAFKKEEFQQKGFEIGAVDYFTKPIEDMQFINRIKLYKELISKTKELEEKNKELEKKNLLLEELSITDNLTKLYNRNRLNQTLVSEFNRASRYPYSFGLMMVDIDYFKKVNDVYGHQVGDKVLKEIAEVLKTHTRKTDIVGRWGGEEFLIICSETDLEGILSLAEKIRSEIASYSFSCKEQKTASIGVSIYKQGDEDKELIKRADDALYQAKESGRNRVVTK